jgi:4-amino-4-deoxy-L-arabinose transferase-like glycosyltransferase
VLEKHKFFNLLLALGLLGLLAAIIVLASVPPVDRDALTHHLAVPKLYLRQGGIYEIPEIPFSYYPMNLDLIYLAALHLGSDIAPKYIHAAFGLLTAWILYGYLRRRLQSTAYGLLGCLLFLSVPVVVKLSITVYVDLGLIFFSTAALLQLFRWAASGFQMRHLLLSGVWTGLCLGTKYNGMLCAFLLGLIVLILPARATGEAAGAAHVPWAKHGKPSTWRALGYAAVFTAVALTVFSPWMIRNYIWTGNPVYPMAESLLGPNTGRPSTETAEVGSDHAAEENSGSGMNHFVLRTVGYGESLVEILLIPLRVFFQGVDDNPKYFDGRLNPYLLIFPLAALALAGRRRRPAAWILEQQVLAGFALVYLLLGFLLTDMRVRYIAPIIPPLVLLAVFGIYGLLSAVRNSRVGWIRRCGAVAIFAGLGGLLVLNGAYLRELMDRVQPFGYLTGKVSRDEYIQNHRPEYAVHTYINRHLDDGSRILCLFTGNRIYYSDREMVCDPDMFRSIIRSAPSSQAAMNALKQRGVTHLFLQGNIFNYWAASQFNGRASEVLEHFFKRNLDSLYQAHGFYLFRLLEG